MPRFALRLAYDGTDFHGWQRQEPPGQEPLRTVQGTLDQALTLVMQASITCQGASRTDAGVHAEAQVAAFTADCRVPVDRIPAALNARLPEDVRVMAAWPVPAGFDPVGDAMAKGYRYEIAVTDPFRARLPFDRRMLVHVQHPLCLPWMREAAAMIPGTRDFAAFAHAQHGRETTVRTVHACEVHTLSDDRIVIDVSGNGFLYNMVRIIAGTVVEAGRGRIKPGDIPGILESGDRTRAGPTLPAQGLRLRWILYPPDRAEPRHP
ncbi:MAG: tRNA pseudouridine synthase [Planctomycetota bacterium]|jgi:tRNA pseudouridine38-40 synthase